MYKPYITMNHYVFGGLIVLLTAILVSAYQYSIDPDLAKKTFLKTLAAGTLATVFLVYILFREPSTSNEPFM